ncbi:nuclear mRNA export, poly(A)+RNA binding protein, partial [Tulasnella sp. 427]
MFSTSNKPPLRTPAGLPARPSTNRKNLASTLLKGSGLVDRDQDARMADSGPSTGSAALQAKRADERRRRTRERMAIPEKDRTNPRHMEQQSFAASMRLGKGSALAGRLGTVGAPPMMKRGAVRPKVMAANDTSKDVNNIQLLRGFVTSRYDKQRRYLNLENLQDDPFFKGGKLSSPDLPTAAKDIGTVMLKLASQLDPPPETVSFANNKFKTLKQLGNIGRYLPDLANLSLQNNDIEDVKTLTYIGSRSDK